jgi:hypothetical protein
MAAAVQSETHSRGERASLAHLLPAFFNFKLSCRSSTVNRAKLSTSTSTIPLKRYQMARRLQPQGQLPPTQNRASSRFRPRSARYQTSHRTNTPRQSLSSGLGSPMAPFSRAASTSSRRMAGSRAEVAREPNSVETAVHGVTPVSRRAPSPPHQFRTRWTKMS